MKNIYLFFIGLFFLVGCGSGENPSSTTSQKEETPTTIEAPKNISFIYEPMKGLEEPGSPRGKIYLQIENEKILVDEETIPGLTEANSASEEMKTNNIALAGTWWAGFGANYAAFFEGRKIIVKKEVVEELTEEMVAENPALAKPQIEVIKEINWPLK